MINKEEYVRKFNNLVKKIKEDRRFFGASLVIIVLIMIGAGSITGNLILKSLSEKNKLEDKLHLTNLEWKTCQKNLENCKNTTTNLSRQILNLEDNISSLTINLSNCKWEKENYRSSLDECTEIKNNLSEKLDACKDSLDNILKDLSELEKKYKKLNASYENVKTNFAKNKCCPDYEYYAATNDGNILCCYKYNESFICGAGNEFSEDKVTKLKC